MVTTKAKYATEVVICIILVLFKRADCLHHVWILDSIQGYRIRRNSETIVIFKSKYNYHKTVGNKGLVAEACEMVPKEDLLGHRIK